MGKIMKNLVDKRCVALVKDSLSITYLTGVKVEEGYLVVSGCDKACFVDARYFSMLKPKLIEKGVKAYLYKDFSCVVDYIKALNKKTVYIDYSKTTIKEHLKIKEHFSTKDYSLRLEKLRSIKNAGELKNIKKACQIAQKAYYFALKKIKLGITELELKEILERKMLSLGAQGTSFDTIVAFGKNSAVPHHQTGQTKLENNTPVLIDMGCKVNGYCSDITRTAFFGSPDKKFIDCYKAVFSANESAIKNITVGTKTCGADAFARNVLKENSLDKYFTHSLGHGVGLEIHEYPFISPKTDVELKNDMVFTIEPGVYFDGEFGIRIEDTVTLKNGKVKRLYTDNKEIILIN